MMNDNDEIEAIKKRYKRREDSGLGLGASRYSPLTPSVYMQDAEKQRKIIECIRSCGISPLKEKRLLEIGCGRGDDALRFIRLGFLPENIVVNELLKERIEEAGNRLPGKVTTIYGDASEIDSSLGNFHVIFQSMIFTSILDDKFRKRLANAMWQRLHIGGGIMWYDFVYNNPKNMDVRGIGISEIQSLFPMGKIRYWRITLAPPIGRLVTMVHPSLYSAINIFPLLRTHVLCWIKKSST